MSAMPKIVYANGAGRAPGRRPDELPPQQHDARRGGRRRRHEHQGRERRQLRGGRQDHDRPGRQRLRQGRPGGPHDHRRRHHRRHRHGHHARRAARPRARERPLRRGLARRHQPRTTRRAPTSAGGTRRRTAPQTAQAFTYWGWRYLQILPPGAGETAGRLSAVVQHSAAPQSRRATFDSDNATLDAVFELMQRSGIYSSEEVFLDTPTREKGQFTGDTVDISYANMIAVGRPQRDRPRDPRDPLQRDALVEGGLQRLLHRRAAAVLVPEHRHARAASTPSTRTATTCATSRTTR